MFYGRTQFIRTEEGNEKNIYLCRIKDSNGTANFSWSPGKHYTFQPLKRYAQEYQTFYRILNPFNDILILNVKSRYVLLRPHKCFDINSEDYKSSFWQIATESNKGLVVFSAEFEGTTPCSFHCARKSSTLWERLPAIMAQLILLGGRLTMCNRNVQSWHRHTREQSILQDIKPMSMSLSLQWSMQQ